MCFAIAGGVKNSEDSYLSLMEKYGIKGKIFNREVPDFGKRIANVDAVIHGMACTCNAT
jgi:hypothetical protein